MEKILLNSKEDLKSAISFFGSAWTKDINDKVKEFPCVLIGKYSEDVEFGDGYDFTAITKGDFDKKAGIRYY